MQDGVRPVDLCKSQDMTACVMAESRKSTPSTFFLNPSPDPKDEASPCPLPTSPQSSTLSNLSPLPDLMEFRSLEEKIQRLASINQKIKETLRTSSSVYSSPESSLRLNPRPARLSTPDTIMRDDGKFLSWLAKYRLESIFPCLIEAGFDDLEQILLQMRSGLPLTEEMLEAAGVRKQGCRAVLLAALERECEGREGRRKTKEQRSSQCCVLPTPAPTVLNFPSVPAWLDLLGLASLSDRFQAAGYLEVEQMLFLMHSAHPVTDRVLQKGVGVDKVGHRHRILCKLREDAQNFDPLLWPTDDSTVEMKEEARKDEGCAIA